MDEVNINKYLSQFNPLLILPVLSAVVGAIAVFLFGFKRPNEPRFASTSSIDSLKKSKRKANNVKNADNAVQSSKQQNSTSAKVISGKKASDVATTAATNKKAATNEKSGSSNNNNTTSTTNNNINKKKTDEKKSENGSPTKKVANKKIGKEAAAPAANKKTKSNKGATADEQSYSKKPADFDDAGWFTVQSKGSKQKNKVDESAANNTENQSPKPAGAKSNKSSKGAKVENKPVATATPVIASELNGTPENLVESQKSVEPSVAETLAPIAVSVPAIAEEPVAVIAKVNEIAAPIVEKKQVAPAATTTNDANAIVENSIAFDELGEWTDAKPDRKRGNNKKKSRKD